MIFSLLKKNSLIFSVLICFTLAACSKGSTSLRIKGSDTEVNLATQLAEAFYKDFPQYTVSVSGGGSGMGIASLLNGQTDIANSSRPLYKDEEELFREKGINIHTVVFAEDATAIIVNKALPVLQMDSATLAGIFSGNIDNWSRVGGPDLKINIYGRQSSSGTHSFVQKKLNIRFSRSAKELNGNAQILEGIKTDRSGIGYVGAGYVSGEGNDTTQVRIISIKGGQSSDFISPLDLNAIRNGTYFFQRPLFQFISGESWQKAQDFLRFERTPRGEAIIKASGYYVKDSI